MKKVGVVIAAGGSSSRIKNNKNKLLFELGNETVIEKTVSKFYQLKEVKEIVVVSSTKFIDKYTNLLINKFGDKVKVTLGGPTRQKSVFNGIKTLSSDTDIVLIHDGARPFVTKEAIIKCISFTEKYKACCLGVRCKDTIKRVNASNMIEQDLKRSELYQVQTPQCFTYKIAFEMHNVAEEKRYEVTDDTALAKMIGYDVFIIDGSYNNIKITTDEDFNYATYLLENS